jgi:hypothetical protein
MASLISPMVFLNRIDGKPCGSDNVSYGTDPLAGTPLRVVPIITENDLKEAVSGAQIVLKAWSKTTRSVRQEFLTVMR